MVELNKVSEDKYRLITDDCPCGREVTLDEAMNYIATKEGVIKKKYVQPVKPVLMVGTVIIVFLANSEIVTLLAMCAWFIPMALKVVKQAIELDGGGKW